MNKDKSSFIFRIVMILITSSLIAFAFIHSSMPSDVSGAESEATMGLFQNILNCLGINIELTDHIVRKLAHFTEYSAIGIMLMNRNQSLYHLQQTAVISTFMHQQMKELYRGY